MNIDPLVIESSAWLDAAAPWSCRRDGDADCAWYHGTWQYLRMLDLVSSPDWHATFFRDALREAVAGHAAPRVLISGCADDAPYAHALAALGPDAAFDVLDWCPTPLMAVAWRARRAGAPPPTLLCADATAHRPPGRYAAIVSDAFLPRFSPEGQQALLAAWRASLSEGGRVITTVRLHERGAAAPSREATIARWVEVAEDAAGWWPSVSRLPHTELVARVATFALRQERTAVTDPDELAARFAAAGFAKVEIAIGEYAGKRFARLAAG